MLNHLPFPLPDLRLSDVDKAMKLIEHPTEGVVFGEEAFPSVGKYLGDLPRHRNAFKASNIFHIRNRCRCRKPTWRSLEERWVNPPVGLDLEGTPTEVFNRLKPFGYVASQFNPYTAAWLYEHVCPLGGNVLDPCAGWGDRLAGAIGCGRVSSYLGYDANSSLQEGYTKQLAHYFGDQYKPFKVVHGAFEDATLPPEAYDVVFTSPPYFNTEFYSVDEEQSTYRYPDWDSWVRGFCHPLIEKSTGTLVRGGHLLLNVADGPLVQVFKDLALGVGLTFVGYWVYLIGATKKEPVLVWRKDAR